MVDTPTPAHRDCPECNGMGGWIEQVGVDEYGDAVGERYQCPMCGGGGLVPVEMPQTS